MYKGSGYCIGPNYEYKGKTVFNWQEHPERGSIVFMIYEDKLFDINDELCRSENSVEIGEDQILDLISNLKRFIKAVELFRSKK